MENIFARGTDTLLQMLAKRDAEARLEEDRQRRNQLDIEDREDRKRQRDLQDKQLASLESSRKEAAADRQAGIDAKLRAEQKTDAYDQLKRDLILQYRNEPEGPRRDEIKMSIMANYPDIKFPEPKVQQGKWQEIRDKKGNVTQQWLPTPMAGQPPPPPIETADRPRVGRQAPFDRRELDDPTFPRAVKSWVDDMLSRGGTLDSTSELVMRGVMEQRGAHPNVDPSKALEYVKKFYSPTGKNLANPGTKAPVPPPPPPAPGRSAGSGPAGAAAPAPPIVNAPGVVAAPKPAAGGGTVKMIAPDGRELDVPPAEVARLVAAGAKLVGG